MLQEADELQLQNLYMTFSESRFGFTQALRSWNENEMARRGLQQSLRRMIQIELAHGAPDAAALLLLDLPEPDAALTQAVEQAQRKQRKRGDRLTKLQHDVDLRIGARARG